MTFTVPARMPAVRPKTAKAMRGWGGDPGKAGPKPFSIEIDDQHGRHQGQKRIRREDDEHPGADEAPDHTVDGQGPVYRKAKIPPAAPEDVGHVDHHRGKHQKKDGRAHIGNQGQQGCGNQWKTDADGAVDQGRESDDDSMGEHG